jgi:hypothetical protein
MSTHIIFNGLNEQVQQTEKGNGNPIFVEASVSLVEYPIFIG